MLLGGYSPLHLRGRGFDDREVGWRGTDAEFSEGLGLRKFKARCGA